MSYLVIIPIIGFVFIFGCMVGYLWNEDHGRSN
jgi:hypothetical protein